MGRNPESLKILSASSSTDGLPAMTSLLRCLEMYEQAGVDFTEYPIVGVGSICRRQGTAQIGAIVDTILSCDPEMPLHLFGCKLQGLRLYGDRAWTADSLAWSLNARRESPLPGHTHSSCSSCLEYALRWRERVLAIRPTRQLSLFGAL
jgi:hypothetical protein